MVRLDAYGLTFTSLHAEECSQLLSQGIYDIHSSASDLNTTSSFSQWFCDKKFSSAEQSNSFGASLGFPFKGIPIKLGFDSSNQGWEKSYSSFCSNVKNDKSLQGKVRDYVQTVNTQIIEAFNQCLQSDGLHVWLERTYDPMVFRFAGKFNPSDPETSPVTNILAFELTKNISCNNKPQKISKTEWRTLCTRKDDSPVSIVVNAKPGPIHGGGVLDLPGIATYPTPLPPPDGAQCSNGTEVVRNIYRQVLERESDSVGLNNWVSLLATKQLNVKQTVNGFVQSPEYSQRFVNGKPDSEVIRLLYKHILARDPDPDGFAHQTANLPSLGFSQIATNFLNSKEYDLRFGNWMVPNEPSKVKYCD
jgi:hypothetical protein